MPFGYIDSTYIMLVIPAMIFAFYAQSRVNSTFTRYSRVAASSRRTGSQVARVLLDAAGLRDVAVERIQARLGDHYDPRVRKLRLSPEVHDGYSLAALGVAAHEAGHALQHDSSYVALGIRNSILPFAQFGSSAALPLFMVGLIFNFPSLMDIGILLFTAVVLFQVVTLPVEYNASARAVELLESGGLISREEVGPTRQVLSAAALTYLAATFVAVAWLLRFLILRGRRD